MHQGVNLPRLSGYNVSVVLDCIRRCPEGLSRVEISKITGLSAQTITNVTRRLLNDGLVKESGTRNIGMGKPRTILRTEPRAMFAVGIRIDATTISGAVLDLMCQPVAETSTPTPRSFGPEAAVAEIERILGLLLDDTGLSRSKVAGLGIAVPGPLIDDDVVLNPPNLPEWHRFDLRGALSERVDWPVFVEKDVIAAATGEKWLRRSDGDFGYLYLATGVGFGLVAKGEVQLGSSRNIGEIGHLRVAATGAPCPCCGTPGLLGQVTRPANIVRQAAELGLCRPTNDPDHPGEVGELFRQLCLRAEEEQVEPLFVELGKHLGSACAVLTDLLDLPEIVLGGPYWTPVPEITLTTLRETTVSRAVLRAVREPAVTSARSSEASESIGVAALVFDRLLSTRLGQLVETRSSPNVFLP